MFAFTVYLSLTLILFGLGLTNFSTLHNTPQVSSTHCDFTGVYRSRTMRTRRGRELNVWSTCSEALTLLGRSRLALALQIAMTMGRFPSLQAMCSGVLPWRSCWSRWQWCLRRQRTTSTWHLRTARWRAVCPSWRQTMHLWSNHLQLITVYVYGNTRGSINPLKLHHHREMIPV